MKRPMASASRFDKEKVAKIIDDIEQYQQELESWKLDRQKLENRQTFYAVSLLVFSITNRYIDLGNEVISTLKLGVPSTYKDIFFLLHKNGLITNQVKQAFFTAIECRNAIAHQYHDITPDAVADALSQLDRMRTFLNKVKTLMIK